MAGTPTSAAVDGNLWIVADIGGTNARCGLWSPHDGVMEAYTRRYRNDDFIDLAELLRAYRKSIGQEVEQALLAIAMPLQHGPLCMTNRSWCFTPDGLRAAVRLKRLWLVNDFAAAAAGVLRHVRHDSQQNIPSDALYSPCLVLGPGTGLGAAVLLLVGDRPYVLPGEAGHMTAAATDPLAARVMHRLAAQSDRTSWEQLLGGSGLAMFDAVVRGVDTPDEAAGVARRLHAGDSAAQAAARAYAHALGEFAGDLCLALRATGGVWLCGGVLAGLGDALDMTALRAGFEKKGRMSALLASTPVRRVPAQDLALRGLHHLLSGEISVPLIDSHDAGARAGGRLA